MKKLSYFGTNWFFYHTMFSSNTMYPISKATSLRNVISRSSSKRFPTFPSEVNRIIARDKY